MKLELCNLKKNVKKIFFFIIQWRKQASIKWRSFLEEKINNIINQMCTKDGLILCDIVPVFPCWEKSWR